jgi:uncharacterized CHY-type Zn-finger protein
MCDLCFRGAPHLPDCPNAPERRTGLFCGCCKDSILEYEEYAEIGEKVVCEYCLDDMNAKDILRILGVDMQTAERPGESFWG